MPNSLHSVTLEEDKCIGCTDCIKRCPTEAIRVRNSKAVITEERCIDCGMCIRVCRSFAKKATTDSLDKINFYKYKVAIPAPTLYTQFKGIDNPNIILTGLKMMGFDEVFEVAKGAEIITDYTKEFIKNNKSIRPIISSACPAIVRMIQIRFPSLIPNIIPVISPKEAMARLAKNYLVKQGIPEEDIGVFFISPCAAKVTISRNPEVLDKSYVDGVLSMKEVYLKLIPILKEISSPETLMMSTMKGINWASSGGEGKATEIDNYLAVDGIENVVTILEQIENRKLDVDFVECLACVNGCLGGPLTFEDSFVAKHRMDHIKRKIKEDIPKREIPIYDKDVNLAWQYGLKNKQIMKLDDDMEIALKKMELIEEINDTLPQIDCSSCGAPTCRALAEDIVADKANIEDCIFMLRMKVRRMAEDMVALARKMPPSISRKSDNKE